VQPAQPLPMAAHSAAPGGAVRMGGAARTESAVPQRPTPSSLAGSAPQPLSSDPPVHA
jgi:hypothetical protein